MHEPRGTANGSLKAAVPRFEEADPMVTKLRHLTAVSFLLVVLVAQPPASAQRRGDVPVVTAASQVTTNPNPTRAHSSPVIARNPENGELVIAETNVYEGFGIDVHISTDDGRSWFRGGSPMMEPYTWNSDFAINGPYFTMAFDDDGALYMALSATDPRFGDLNRAQRPRPIFLARSSDSGRSFATDFVYRVAEDNPKVINNRRPMVAIDPKDSSKIYVSWLQTSSGEKSRSLIAASSDGGRSFSEPVDLAEPVDQGGYQSRPAVGPDGVVHAIFPGGGFTPQAPPGAPAPEMPVRPLFYRQSSDSGRTWSPPRVIDQGSAGFDHMRKPLLAADPDSGALYAVWYGSSKTRPTAEDDSDVLVRVSPDGGSSWSDPVTVNDDATSPNTRHYDPGIAITPNGRVDIAWYDFRNSPVPESVPPTFAPPFNNGGFQDVYYASSTDAGRSFSPNVRITDRMIDRRIGVWSNNIHSHYNVGIASTNNTVYFAWQDSRNGDSLTNSEDVYFAALLRDPPEAVADDSGSEVPGWVLLGAGAAAGMGVAMILVLLATRRGRPSGEPATVR
ncbi:MAG TPA: sialidase family protein [Acidimicrobiales bacterium]|nr:sialidase family protein [Acidimicrobiales bacterium]